MNNDQPQRPLPTDLPAPGQPLPPPAPVAPGPVPSDARAYPEPGTQYMAKGPAVNTGWEVCQILANPNDPSLPLVVFPDGTQYTADSVQIGGRVGEVNEPQTAPGQAPNAAVPAVGLKQDFNDIKNQLVNLNIVAQRTFGVPLDVLLTMVQRYSLKAGLQGTGRMAVFGGLSQFVPNDETFDKWVEAYMLEIQRRLGTNDPEV